MTLINNPFQYCIFLPATVVLFPAKPSTLIHPCNMHSSTNSRVFIGISCWPARLAFTGNPGRPDHLSPSFKTTHWRARHGSSPARARQHIPVNPAKIVHLFHPLFLSIQIPAARASRINPNNWSNPAGATRLFNVSRRRDYECD